MWTAGLMGEFSHIMGEQLPPLRPADHPAALQEQAQLKGNPVSRGFSHTPLCVNCYLLSHGSGSWEEAQCSFKPCLDLCPLNVLSDMLYIVDVIHTLEQSGIWWFHTKKPIMSAKKACLPASLKRQDPLSAQS